MTLSANRFLNILPVISNLRIRRTWRGYYPKFSRWIANC